jgi:hypothetical protein
MGSKSKSFALILVLIMAISNLSLMLVKPAFAQTPTPTPSAIPTPSAPEFTLQPVGPSYTDPITDYHVEFSAVNVTIKNQPFTPYANSNTPEISLYYNVRIKDHNEPDNWTNLYFPDGYLPQSNSDNTTMSILVNIGQNGGIISVNTQTDIQVQAMIGYSTSSLSPFNPSFTYQFVGTTSGWSPTQTITIPANSTSPTPTSAVPEFPTLILIFTFLLLATLLGTVVIKRKQSIGWIV